MQYEGSPADLPHISYTPALSQSPQNSRFRVRSQGLDPQWVHRIKSLAKSTSIGADLILWTRWIRPVWAYPYTCILEQVVTDSPPLHCESGTGCSITGIAHFVDKKNPISVFNPFPMCHNPFVQFWFSFFHQLSFNVLLTTIPLNVLRARGGLFSRFNDKKKKWMGIGCYILSLWSNNKPLSHKVGRSGWLYILPTMLLMHRPGVPEPTWQISTHKEGLSLWCPNIH